MHTSSASATRVCFGRYDHRQFHQRFYFQSVDRDHAGGPAGFNASSGLEVSFCP